MDPSERTDHRESDLSAPRNNSGLLQDSASVVFGLDGWDLFGTEWNFFYCGAQFVLG